MQPTRMLVRRSAAARCGALALLWAALGLAGCESWFQDRRPYLFNATGDTVEVEAVHADGHSLRVRLSPGASVPLGVASDPIREIVVRQQSHVVLRVPEQALKSCLAASSRLCHGWSLQSDGAATFGLR